MSDDINGGTALDDLTLRQDDHVVAKIFYDSDVVGDEDHREAQLVPDVEDQVEDLHLHGHVQR